jgi:hypothetical protein
MTVTPLVCWAVGLSSDQVASRRETVGHNAIEVTIPSPIDSFLAEFSSAFYIYQVRCLPLLLWLVTFSFSRSQIVCRLNNNSL